MQQRRRYKSSKLTLADLHGDQLDAAIDPKWENENHRQSKRALLSHYSKSFSKWLLYLVEGHSLLLYGYGSKKILIEQFLQDGISESFPVMELKGYHPACNVKHLLNNITEQLLSYPGLSFPSLLVQCEFIVQYFAVCQMQLQQYPEAIGEYRTLTAYLKPREWADMAAPEHFFIAIHNVEKVGGGGNLQTILSMLAAVPQIHVIASMDHIFSPLIWDDLAKARYNWVFLNTYTFQPYYDETQFDHFFQKTSVSAEKPMLQALQALPRTAQQAFLLLSEHQLQNPKASGMSFDSWFSKCVAENCANKESVCHTSHV